MAKTKGKGKAAASNTPSKAEVVSDNDMIAESAPSKSVEIEEAAMTKVFDKSGEVDKKEETGGGPDESKEVDETEEIKDDIDESEKVDTIEEHKDALDKSEDADKKEETTDALDNPEEGNKESAAAMAMVLDKSVEIDKKEETEDGPDESEEVNEAEKEVDDLDKSGEVDKIEDSKDGLDKSEDGDKKEETVDALDNSEEGDNEEETKVDGKVESTGTDAPEGEKVEEGDVTKEVKANDKEKNAPVKKAKRMRKRKKKAASSAAASTVPEGEKVDEGDAIEEFKENDKEQNAPNKRAKKRRRRRKTAASAVASSDADNSNDANKRGTAAAEKKDSRLTDGMGLIFMCNAKTKKDCFLYKVFGLPASKKELVAKVYKGMTLFLFDIDLKLMYGIYKAANSGGYNIEPKAFKSAFPSQVRFDVLNDCLPLPEEKFKEAIKGNYYGKNKFNCQLSPEQVKNLCKLFQSAGKTSKKKGSREVIAEETEPTSSARGRKRSRHETERRDDNIPRGRDLHARREAHASPPRKRSRRERARRDDNIPRGRDLYARREAYRSPPRTLALPPQPLHPVSYAYGRSVDDYYYRREPPLEYRDPYSVYRDPFSREVVYREPIPYHEALYPASSTPAAPPILYNALGSTAAAVPTLYNASSSTLAAPPTLYNALSSTAAAIPIPYNASSSTVGAPPTLYYRY